MTHKEPINIKYYVDVNCSKCGNSRRIYKHSIKKNNLCKKCSSLESNKKRGNLPSIVDGKLSCSTCKNYLNLDSFHNNKAMSHRFGKSLHCKSCDLKRTTKRRKSAKTYTLKDFYNNCKTEQKKKKGFNLSYEDFIEIFNNQNGKCALTNETLTFIKNNQKVYTNISIDRIDSNTGYFKENIQFVCYIVNIMKNKLTVNELKSWCEKILCQKNP